MRVRNILELKHCGASTNGDQGGRHVGRRHGSHVGGCEASMVVKHPKPGIGRGGGALRETAHAVTRNRVITCSQGPTGSCRSPARGQKIVGTLARETLENIKSCLQHTPVPLSYQSFPKAKVGPDGLFRRFLELYLGIVIRGAGRRARTSSYTGMFSPASTVTAIP